MTPRFVTLLCVVLVAFAANSILNRLALTGTDTGPASFAALRMVSGAAMLVLLVASRDKTIGAVTDRLSARDGWQMAATLLLYVVGFSFAYLSLDAGLGALILFGGVQITMLAGALIAGERLTLRRQTGAGIAFAGLTWLLWPQGAAAPPLGGAVLMLAAALGWGLYSLLGRGVGDALGATAAAFLLASPPVLLLGLVLRDGLDLPGAALAILSGAVTSGMGYALWYSLLPRLEASAAGVAQLSVPVIAALGGVLILHEPLSLRLIGASALVIGGVAWSLSQPRAGKT
ncbi:MAG: DMT family transporter [Pseudomonadota bacterium]